MLLRALLLAVMFPSLAAAAECTTRRTSFKIKPGMILKGHVTERFPASSMLDCLVKCTSQPQVTCKSVNYIQEGSDGVVCEMSNSTEHSARKQDFVRRSNSKYLEPELPDIQESIEDLRAKYNAFTTDDGWTLVARFSNADDPQWMNDHATWWYDQISAIGDPNDPSANTDMISEAFWKKPGKELKITKSDDLENTALLTTTGNCLEGKTFREKIASYGEFRRATSWRSADDAACLGKCAVVYGGNYATVDGFAQASCDGDKQGKDNIGFWCDYSGDASVMMIGGGGIDPNFCMQADHGIGITENDQARFDSPASKERDFGDNVGMQSSAVTYSLNLWVR